MDLDDGRVITNFIRQIKRGEAITIYGDGTQTRSFCYVDDMVRALVAFMGAAETSVGDVGPVNIGNPHELTMVELARLIIMVCNSTVVKAHGNSEVVYSTLPQDDPKQRCPDITLAKRVLGWEPTTSLIDGLISTVRHLCDDI